MKKLFCLVLPGILLAISSIYSAETTKKPLMMILVDNTKNNKAYTNLTEFGIDVIVFKKTSYEKDKGKSILENLPKCSVVFIKSRMLWREIIEYHTGREALRDFLRKGGTFFCGYGATGNGNRLMFFIKEAAEVPWVDPSTHRFSDGIAKDKNSFLADIDQPFRGHSGWKSYIKPFKPLVVMQDDPEAVMLLMQENVLGDGRIIYSNLIDFLLYGKGEKWRKRRHKNIKALINLMVNRPIQPKEK